MTHLVIENQNSNTEIVSAAIILKLYEMALSAEGDVSLKGNLLSDHAKLSAYNYLTGNLPDSNNKRFPNLSLNITSGLYVDFADLIVGQKMLTKFGDGTGVVASSVTGNINESWGFKNNTDITTFNELGLFTNVTKISNGEYAFYGCTNLLSIDLYNITEIGANDSKAFRNCTSLVSVGNTSNLQKVGDNAFRDCTALASINLSNCTYIWPYAFKGCSNLAINNLDISGKTVSIESFEGCSKLTGTLTIGSDTIFSTNARYDCGTFKNTGISQIILPSNMTRIYDQMFMGCTSLTSVDLSNVIKLDNNVFNGCTSLTSIGSLSNCNDIGGGAFNGCSNLTISNLDLSGKSVGIQAFLNCSKLTGTLTIGSNTTIGTDNRYGAHFQGTGISQVVLPSNFTTVEYTMFEECASLSSINLSNVTTIKDRAFYRCYALTHVDVSNATFVGLSVFYDCTSLGVGETLEITHTGTIIPSSIIKGTKYIGLIMHCPNITNWDVRYPAWEGATSLQYLDISDCAFTTCGPLYGNSLLLTYILPASLTSLDNRIVEALPNLQYFIILAETPPTASLTYAFRSLSAPNADIYVKDSTAKAAYLADANWSLIPNASTRIKTLAELPVGVWKTGLYQLYEPYLSHSSDPAYATT